MRVLISGCGGIGGNLGARLLHRGHPVTFVTGSPRVTDALRAHGARLEGVGVQGDDAEGEGDGRAEPVPAHIPVPEVVTEPGEAKGPFDLALLISQSPALKAACEAVAPVLADDGLAVCFQNGLPEEIAREVLGDRVLGCVVGWGGSMPEPGRYRRTSRGVLVLGERGGQSGDRVRRVGALLEDAMPVEISDNLDGVRWSKLAINSAITTIGAVTGQALGEMLVQRHLRRAFLEVITEAVRVATAAGVTLEPVKGTLDLQKLALTPAESRTRIGSAGLLKKHSIVYAVGLKYRRLRSSMLYALEKGRMPEVDWLNGAIVAEGKRQGVPTPVNSHLQTRVHEIHRCERRSDPVNLSPDVVTNLRGS